MRITTLICLIMMLFALHQVNAQSHPIGSPNITNFSKIAYKAGTQNWMIEQDQKGIVYFANNKGLLQFDGTYWSTLPLPKGTVVRSIAVHDDGKIYIGGQDEFGYFEPNTYGQLIFHSLVDLIPNELRSFEDVWKIFIKGDRVYFCSAEAIFQYTGNEIEIAKTKKLKFENFFEVSDKVYVQEADGVLYEVTGSQLIPFVTSEIFNEERIAAMLPHKDGKMLVITFSNGLFLMSKQGVEPWENPANEFLKVNQAFCAIELKNGKYAVGTPQNGALIMSREGEPELHLNEAIGMQNNTVLSLAQDYQENLWLGLDNGIDYAEINSCFSIIRSEQGITGTGYASVIHEDKLYLGTNQGLFYTGWNEKESPISVQKFKAVENGLGQVWSIDKLDRNIIVGQHKGASYLDDKRLERFSNVQGAWKFLPLDSHPNFALEGTYSGLYLYKRGTDNSWEKIQRIAGFDESSRVFEEGKHGEIWVSHAYKGLYRLTFSDDLTRFKNVELFGLGHGLPDSLLINVSKVRNELIFSTTSGVYKYDEPNNHFVLHQDFLEIFGADRNFHRILQDELGNIWFSVDNEFGVIVVEEQGVFNKFQIYYFNQIQDDLVDGFEHVYAYDKENIIIGTEKGFLHYAPSNNKKTDFPFNILIRKVTSITQGDSIVYWGNTAGQLDKAYSFNYKMNDFRFSFSVPYYEKIGYLTYRFKLEGFDDNWTAWSPKTEKEYTNLGSGDYEFKVQAKNAYGKTSKEASFNITIQPPWYWSWYAKALYFILGILALFSLTKFISKRERKKTEAFKREQTEKLVKKEAEFKKEVERSESEIIKLRNEKLQGDIKNKTGQLASATMHLVQKSEILIKIKNDLKGIESEASKDIKKRIQQITRTIESDIRLDENWTQFENYFDQVHENFLKRLRLSYPELTPKDQKLCAYLRMNLTTKEIAPLMNISVRGVEISRYRLRKKLGLDSEVNLVAFILEI